VSRSSEGTGGWAEGEKIEGAISGMEEVGDFGAEEALDFGAEEEMVLKTALGVVERLTLLRSSFCIYIIGDILSI
jgi:hypothetical protein